MTEARSKKFFEVLEQDGPLLMDGALGTELQCRGVPFEETCWGAHAINEHADIIRSIHTDYILAGARIHIVNSFSLARHVLEPVGLGDQFETLNRRTVELFKEAVEQTGIDRKQVFAAGSLSTFAANSDRSILPDISVLEENYRNQAQILFEAGVDLFTLEMLFDVRMTFAMLRAVSSFNLPVIIGFTCEWQVIDGQKVVMARSMGGERDSLGNILSSIISEIKSPDIIFSIMHSDLDVTDAALEVLREVWTGPIAIYPNSGEFVNLQLQVEGVCSVDAFSQASLRWLSQGVDIVGGCCGIGPTHISGLNHALLDKASSSYKTLG
jgi:S-methylmethionine-dependent homocysteine/selenocysteine methylase